MALHGQGEIMFLRSLVCLVLVSTSVAAYGLTEFPVTTAPGWQLEPAVSGNTVVWRSGIYDSDVWARSLPSAAFSVDSGAANQWAPAISGSWVAWLSNSAGQTELRALNLSGGSPVTVASADLDPYVSPPAISGSKVAWAAQNIDSVYNVYYKDLAGSGGVNPVAASSTYSQGTPAISGNNAAWIEDRTATGGTVGIYATILGSGTVYTVAPDTGWWTSLAISGSTVVWQDGRNGNGDIYGRNFLSGGEFAVCADSAEQWNPDISGDFVIWQDNRNDNWDIFGKNLQTGEEFAVTTNSANQMFPATDGLTVVWEDDRGDLQVTAIYGATLPEPSTIRTWLHNAATSEWGASTGNWDLGVPGLANEVVFDAKTISTPMPNLEGPGSAKSIEFKTGDWTIAGSGTLTVETGNITSAGAAGTTNTIAPEIQISAGATAATFTVNGDDATHNLVLTAPLAIGSRTLDKNGIGTLTTAAITAGTVNHNAGILNAASVTSTDFNVYSAAVVTGAVNVSGSTQIGTMGSLTAASHTGGSLGVYGSANYGTGSVSLTGAAAVGNGTDAATLSAGTVIADSLTILNNAKVTTVGGKTRTSVLGSLVFGGTEDDPLGKFDLTDGLLAINYTGASPLTAIQKAIIEAFNGGDWAGNGITSALLILNPTGKYGIGYVENKLLPKAFGAATPFGDYTGADDTTVLVRYTLIGDVNLDGIINDADISLVTNHIGQTGGGWLGGDVFGYDNIVNDSDISLTTNNIGQSVGQLTGGISELAAVPEPATLALVGLAGLAVIARRRR